MLKNWDRKFPFGAELCTVYVCVKGNEKMSMERYGRAVIGFVLRSSKFNLIAVPVRLYSFMSCELRSQLLRFRLCVGGRATPHKLRKTFVESV